MHVRRDGVLFTREGESPVRAVWFLALSCSNYGSPPPSHELRKRSSATIFGPRPRAVLQLNRR